MDWYSLALGAAISLFPFVAGAETPGTAKDANLVTIVETADIIVVVSADSFISMQLGGVAKASAKLIETLRGKPVIKNGQIEFSYMYRGALVDPKLAVPWRSSDTRIALALSEKKSAEGRYWIQGDRSNQRGAIVPLNAEEESDLRKHIEESKTTQGANKARQDDP